MVENTITGKAYVLGHIEAVVLASGDGDFTLLVDTLRLEHGVEVELYGVPALTAGTLIQSATRFVPLEGDLLL